VQERTDASVLRLPTAEELPGFLEMFRAQLGGSESAALGYLGLSWDKLSELFETVGEIRSVVEGEALAGFVWIELRNRELHVHGIVLSPSFRGHGLGSRVFRELQLEFSKAADLIELGVQEENADAIGFYRHLGFRAVDEDTAPGFLIMRMRIARNPDS
jgi:ribosomal protein S18 acetylase RimI-like enzyme